MDDETPAHEQFASRLVALFLTDGTPTSVTTVSSREDYWVLKCVAHRQSTSWLVKLAGPQCQLPLEFATTELVTRLAAEAGVPVPAVLAWDDSYRDGPWRYIVQQYVEGREWLAVRPMLSPTGVTSAYRQLGDAVASLRSVTFDSYGPVQGLGQYPSLIEALESRARLRILDAGRVASFVEFLHERADLFTDPSPACLCHDDLHHRNVLFDRTGDTASLKGLIDWDKAWAGPAESDLARMSMWDDMTGPGFWPAYRERWPAADGEADRRPIYQLLWCLEYDVSTPRHTADTQRLARRLGLTL